MPLEAPAMSIPSPCVVENVRPGYQMAIATHAQVGYPLVVVSLANGVIEYS